MGYGRWQWREVLCRGDEALVTRVRLLCSLVHRRTPLHQVFLTGKRPDCPNGKSSAIGGSLIYGTMMLCGTPLKQTRRSAVATECIFPVACPEPARAGNARRLTMSNETPDDTQDL